MLPSRTTATDVDIEILHDGEVVATIPTEEMPHNVRFTADGKTGYVTLQGGASMGALLHSLVPHGRMVPVGTHATPGFGLLTMGGIGHLSRKHGLACDNLLSAQVVTADGRILTASEDENPDLFWINLMTNSLDPSLE